ncbi:MAG: beta-N-acetylhexosaminidase family protein [Pirellulaceae bacterium]
MKDASRKFVTKRKRPGWQACRVGRLSLMLMAAAIPWLAPSRSRICAGEPASAGVGAAEPAAAPFLTDGRETSELERVRHLRAKESAEAYDASPYAFLSKDYFARFTRDPAAQPADDEVLLAPNWRIVVLCGGDPLAGIMAHHLSEFLAQRMELRLPVEAIAIEQWRTGIDEAIVLLDSGDGVASVEGSYTLSVESRRVIVRGRDTAGVRDGVVKLVDMIGARQAPILPLGQRAGTPRLAVRLGVVPWMGSMRDLVFMGYNAVLLNTYFEGEESLFALSVSDAIPELVKRRRPEILNALIHTTREAKRYGVKTYCQVNTRKKFPKDDPIFAAHPEIRGALTWKADGEYVLCTEHPLVQRYLMETVEELFRSAELDGLLLINGGESFYHCFMRSFGTAKGHTNCPRCEPLGAEAVVAGLSNHLVAAARKVNPQAEIIAWPYSAEHVWSADRYQIGLIERLEPGAGIFTEIEKDETVIKPDGIVKYIGDYSIDLIGPGERALKQLAACKSAGVLLYIKSEPELGFEAPRLPFIPCLDRWAARAEALASCEPDGAWVFPYFRPNFGSSAAEVFKYFWWEPTATPEQVLHALARRAAGVEAGPHLRAAWKHVSQAIEWSPEQPPYYTGPYYLGPAHPMCISPVEPLPEVFYGQFLFMGETTDAEGLALRPIFVTSPSGNVPIFGKFYRQMEVCLRHAVLELESADPLVPERNRRTFEAECSPIRWFYHTARTQANFYESCPLRDALLEFADRPDKEEADRDRIRAMFERWKQVLWDEKANAEEALPVVEADMRLDCYYGIDHAFPHTADMIRAKLDLLTREINETLPGIEQRCALP